MNKPRTTPAPRGHTAAEADARFIPGRKWIHDLPDHYDADETDGDGVIAWLALALFIVFAIGAAVVIFGGLPA